MEDKSVFIENVNISETTCFSDTNQINVKRYYFRKYHDYVILTRDKNQEISFWPFSRDFSDYIEK